MHGKYITTVKRDRLGRESSIPAAVQAVTKGKQAETILISGQNSPRDTVPAVKEKHKRG